MALVVLFDLGSMWQSYGLSYATHSRLLRLIDPSSHLWLNDESSRLRLVAISDSSLLIVNSIVKQVFILSIVLILLSSVSSSVFYWFWACYFQKWPILAVLVLLADLCSPVFPHSWCRSQYQLVTFVVRLVLKLQSHGAVAPVTPRQN